MSTVERPMLGVGIYSPREAARYVRADISRFRRWIYGTKRSAPVFDPDIQRVGSREIVTFLDFAQALCVQDIRLNVGVPLQRIREAYETARTEHGVTHPFAMKNRIVVFGNLEDPKKCALVLCKDDETQDVDFLQEKYVQLTGKKKGNALISEVVQKFSKQLYYSDEGLAGGYTAFEGFGHRVLIEPDVRFGKPYIADSVYEAETLADAVRHEGSVKRVSELYEVSQNAVKAAVQYMEELDTDPSPIKPKKIAA